jgi:hypothetical protein
MRSVSNAISGKTGEVPDNEVNAHLGNPGQQARRAMAGFFKGLLGPGRSRAGQSPSRKLRELYEAHAGLAREKQFALQEFLDAGAGKGPSSLSLPSKALSLDGGRFVYAVQLLGTRADGDNTWLWAWANPGPHGQGFPSELLSSVEEVRAFGQQQGVPELTMPCVELGDRSRQVWFDVHFLGLIACGLSAGEYYVGVPHPGGEALVMFNAPEVTAYADPLRMTIRMTGFFLDIGSVIPVRLVDHRRLVSIYAQQKGYRNTVSNEREIVWELPTGHDLVVAFNKSAELTMCAVKAV